MPVIRKRKFYELNPQQNAPELPIYTILVPHSYFSPEISQPKIKIQ